MNKQLSLAIKGIAIIMMIVLHINAANIDMSELASTWVVYLRRVCVPVPLFLLLSGYGLSYLADNQGDTNICGGGYRIGKLFINYWVACLPFIIVYAVLKDPEISLDAISVIYNVTAFHTSWNFACWFIFPYSLLLLLLPFFRKVVKAINRNILLSILFFMYIGSGYIISRFHIEYQNPNYLLYNIVYFVFMILPFVFGIVAFQTKLFDSLKELAIYKKIAVIIVFTLFTIFQLYYSTTAFDYIYAILLVITLNLVTVSKHSKILSFLGKHSMNIWLIHAFFLRGVISKITYFTNSFTIALLSILILGVCYSMIIQNIQKKVNIYFSSYYKSLFRRVA